MTLITRSGNSFRNTPTVRTSGGNRLTISDTLETATCRGDGAKTKPIASAPTATANKASSSLVIPQIFMNTLRRYRNSIDESQNFDHQIPQIEEIISDGSSDLTNASPIKTA